ncbi:hypothetical protein BC628DRAFT_1168273 [Trametes gibbosa]|nr:hypothetical protein BC628DRAFT_1168273 [Trametes gibbosa]
MSRRHPTANGLPTTSPQTAYGLALLSEYTHTLDSVPADLSRSFGDLRELDAVLSSSITALTAKVNELIVMIETQAGTNDDRLFLLTEIAEEAARLKLGGEDKIRVACHAADGLRAHKAHMKALLELIPDGEFARGAEALSRKTAYPHVATRNFYPPGMAGEGGRRNRRTAGAATGYNGLLVNGVEASPGKRKKAVRDDDDVTRTPSKKERLDNGQGHKRNGARPRRERATSPTESVMSVASHLPQNVSSQPAMTSNRQNASGRAGSNSSSNKRNQADAVSRREAFSAQPPSSSHPSLPAPYAASSTNVLVETHDVRAMSNGVLSDWPHGQLEGPGMPVARNLSVAVEGNDGTMSAGGEPDGDADDGKTYCFCDGVSYGEMIACDDDECEKEWFHIACVGLTVVPKNTWYCSRCLERRQNQRKAGRGGKKRTAGGRAARNGA